MNPSSHGAKNLASSRKIFLLFSVCFIGGDVLGLSGGWYPIFGVTVTLLLVALFRKGYQYLFFFGALGLMLGGTIGGKIVEQKHQDYTLLRHITEDFRSKGDMTLTIEKIAYKKERSWVYAANIDKFDKFDKNNRSTIYERNTRVDEGDFSSTIRRYFSYKPRATLFVEIPSNLDIIPGSQIRVVGTIKKNIHFPISGYDRYVYNEGGYGHLFVSTFDMVYKPGPSILDISRSWWEEFFRKSFPEEVAGTLLGMTIGSVSLLSSELKNAFIQSGTAHILVVSGSNIAFLILFLSFFLKYIHIRRRGRILIISATVVGYIGLVGADTSVVRAGIMGLLSFLAISHGWQASSRSLLALAAIVLILIDPTAPLYDAGFGLSFSATLGIIIFQKQIGKLAKKWGFPDILSDTLAMTLGASLGSLPILIYHFEKLPIASLLANIIIAGVLGWILFSSVLFAGIATLWKTLSVPLGLLVYLPTRFIIEVSRFFGNSIILSIPNELAGSICVMLLGIYTFFYLDID